jgi:hypothetical protein
MRRAVDETTPRQASAYRQRRGGDRVEPVRLGQPVTVPMNELDYQRAVGAWVALVAAWLDLNLQSPCSPDRA